MPRWDIPSREGDTQAVSDPNVSAIGIINNVNETANPRRVLRCLAGPQRRGMRMRVFFRIEKMASEG